MLACILRIMIWIRPRLSLFVATFSYVNAFSTRIRFSSTGGRSFHIWSRQLDSFASYRLNSNRFLCNNPTSPIFILNYKRNVESNSRLFSNNEEELDDFVCDESSPYHPILKDLNPSQVRAVTQPLTSITRVVAGPGSGKTRVLTSRIAFLLEEDMRSNILAVTFTKKAASEMENRLQKLLLVIQEAKSADTKSRHLDSDSVNEYYDDNVQRPVHSGIHRVSVGTFHSICARILRTNGEALSLLPSVVSDMERSHNQTNLDGKFNIIDQGEQLRVIKECLSDHSVTLKNYDLKPMDILSGVSFIKQEIIKGKNPFGKERKRSLSTREQIALKVYYTYREKLFATNCIDFDDIIYLTRELLMLKSAVREQFRKKWTHILVDEFQDTSQVQLDLVKLLTSSSLLVVGDADQSIYSWRGAHVGSMSDFENDFRAYHPTGVATVYLMENYRSTENIVKAAQKVISNSGDSSQNDALRQKMIPKRSKGPPPRVVSFLDGKSEAEYVVKQVKQKIDLKEVDKNYSIACIYRTNAQSRAIEEACVMHNVPYVLFGSATSFYKRQEVKDSLCFLRWLYNGWDRGSMLRSFTTPKRGIGDSAISEFDQYCALVDTHWEENAPGIQKPTPLEVLLHISGDDSWCTWKDADFPPLNIAFSGRSLKPMASFSLQMQKIRDVARRETLETLLSAVIDEMELIPHFDKISKTKSEFEERKENVFELQRASQKYNSAGPCFPLTSSDVDNSFSESSLGNFLDDVTLVTDLVDNTDSSSDERLIINLMTIHASKGLEFDTVYLLGMEDGTLPTSQAVKEGKDSVVFEEERRLCYVAMTRAKTELVMTWRREVLMFLKDGVKTVNRNRSRFLDVLLEQKRKSSSSDIVQNSNPLRSKLNPLTPAQPNKVNSKDFSQQRKYQSSTFKRQNTSKGYSNSFEGTAAVYSKQKYQLPGSLLAKETGKSRDPFLSSQPKMRSDFDIKTAGHSEKLQRQPPSKSTPMIKQAKASQVTPRMPTREPGSVPISESL